MFRYILHLLSLLILCHAVQGNKDNVEIVKITVLRTKCGTPACSNVRLYYTNSWCPPQSESSNDAFIDIHSQGNSKLDFSTKADMLLSPSPKLISDNDNAGMFFVVVGEGHNKVFCCENKTARHSSDTDKSIHLQRSSVSHHHYSFDLRVQTICVSNTFCTGFYCNDCEKPQIDAWTQNRTEVGETAVLHCNVSSQSGVRSIYWQKYNSVTEKYKNVTTNNRLMGGNLSTPSLTLMNVEKDDTGNYTCFAVKGNKTASSEVVSLNVMEAEPIVMAWIEHPAEVGEKAVLHCNVSSTTVVRTVYWKKYNSSTQMYSNISTNIRYQVGNTSTPSLTILNVRIDDEGNYICSVATGSRTTSSEAVYLNVLEATTQISISTDVSTLESEASTPSELSNLETIQRTTVSRAEQTTDVQITSVHNLPNTTLSNTVSSSSILTTTILTLQTTVASEAQKQNSTRTTTTVSKPALGTTKSSTTVQARDKNSQLNESSKPIIKETSANVKAWIGLTVALSVTEIILIVLVIYIIWLRKQTRSNKEKIKALSCIDTHSNRMGSNWYGETPPYRMDHLSYQGTLTSRAGDILYQEINPNEQRVSSNQDSDSHGNSVNKRQYTTEQEPLYSKINKIADPKQAITQSHTNKKRTSDTKHEDDSTNSNIIIEMSNEDINSNKQNDDLCCETQSDQNKQNLSLETNQNQVVSSNSDKHKDQKSGDMSSDILQNMQSNDIQLNSSTTNVLLPNDMTSTQQKQSTQDKTHL